MSSKPEVQLGKVTIDPSGSAEISHDFASGTLKIGAERNGSLVDATVQIIDLATGKPMGRGRTYTSANSNPKVFILPPGDYRVLLNEIRGETGETTVTLAQGEVVERMIDPSGDN
jgi:hypothetical protein